MIDSLKRFKDVYGLTLGHMGVDIPQGALAAILPFLIAAYHFNYTTAAMLVMVSNLVGSVVQPLFGQLADRRNTCRALILGVIMAGGGITVTGFISDFTGLCIAVTVMGIGVSMYHPEAALLVNCIAAGERLSTSISIFSFGGQAGFAIGPVIATLGISVFGLRGTLIFLVITVPLTALLAKAYGRFNEVHEGLMARAEEDEETGGGRDSWPMFARLSGVIFGRSIVYASLNTFIALYWIEQMDGTEAQGAALLTLFNLTSAVSVIIGGNMADRLGNIRMTRWGSIIAFISLVVFAIAPGKLITVLSLIPMAFGGSLMYSPAVVLGQQYLPNRKGFASGVTMGLAVSVGGIAAPLLGRVGDIYGLGTTMAVTAVIGILPVVSSMILKEPEI